MKMPSTVPDVRAVFAAIDKQHDETIKADPDPGYVDLATSVFALGAVITMFGEHGIRSQALGRLHIALEELRQGSPPAPMLLKRTPPHRPGDSLTSETIKGGGWPVSWNCGSIIRRKRAARMPLILF
jgi:hypothetical protein